MALLPMCCRTGIVCSRQEVVKPWAGSSGVGAQATAMLSAPVGIAVLVESQATQGSWRIADWASRSFDVALVYLAVRHTDPVEQTAEAQTLGFVAAVQGKNLRCLYVGHLVVEAH